MHMLDRNIAELVGFYNPHLPLETELWSNVLTDFNRRWIELSTDM